MYYISVNRNEQYEIEEVEIIKETPKQYKIKGSMWDVTLNKSDLYRNKSCFGSQYHAYGEDQNLLIQEAKEFINEAISRLEAQLHKQGELLTSLCKIEKIFNEYRTENEENIGKGMVEDGK